MKRLIEDIKQASPLIYEAKGSTEALNKAHGTIKFLNSVIAGLRGEPNIMNIAFSKTTQVDGAEYFALPVLFGRFGIQARYAIPRILPFENDLIRESAFGLQRDTEFAKLFCKSRETAAETCSRNVAIRYRKSKEFEQFVNGLKINKKETITEDKIANKIKPPIPIDHLSGDNSFDPNIFCLRHRGNNLEGKKIIPAYMRTGERIIPVSLSYTLGNDNGITQFVPKSSSAETLTCEPAVCPDKPKGNKISFTSITSLVESLVKKTTEKMINEKVKDESLKKSLKQRPEKEKNLRAKPDRSKTCLRKFDMLKTNSENFGNFKSNTKKVRNLSRKAKTLIKNKFIPVKDGKTDIGNKSAIPVENININKQIDDKANTRKRKYQEKTLESIFRPTYSTFREKFDYKSDIRKNNHSNDLKQAEGKQPNINISNENHTQTTVVKHEKYYKDRKMFDFKSQSQSSQYQRRIVPTSTTIDTPTTGDNKNYRNLVINKNILNQKEYRIEQDKEKNFKKNQKNSNINKPIIEKHIPNSSNYSEKYILGDDSKTITTNNYGNDNRKHLLSAQDYKTEQHKGDSSESIKNKKLAISNTELENKKHIWDKYKNVNKTCNASDPLIKLKYDKNMNNSLLENLNNSSKKENIFYDKVSKKRYELLFGRNLEKKTNGNIENVKSLFSDKFCKDTKDFVKNKLRGKYSINKPLNRGEKDSISQITKIKNSTADSESKVNDEVKSICYNAFSNEVTQINHTAERHDSEVNSATQNQYASKNNNIENNPLVPCIKEIKSILEPKHDKKQANISTQENQSSTYDNKDLNMLIKTLDSDVFKCDDKVNTNDFIKDRVKQVNTTENDSYEAQLITNVTASNQDNLTEKHNELIKSEIKEKGSPDLENSQTIQQTDNPESIEPTFEEVIKEIKLALSPSNQQNKSTEMSKSNKDIKLQSIVNVIEDKPVIENQIKNHEKNEGSHSFPQCKETILKKESSNSNKNMACEPINKEKGSVKNQIDLKMCKMNSVLKNTTKSSDKSKKKINECHQSKSPTQTKAPCSVNNPDHNNKLSAITERFLSNKARENRSNEKPNQHEGDSVGYIKALRNSSQSKENNKPQRKDPKQEGFKVSVMNLNDLGILDKSVKQKKASIKNSIQVEKPLTPSSKYSKSFITSKYDLIDKKKNISDMYGHFSGQFGRKVDEINRTEHSFSLKDKNGINNYYLLKGLQSKIKNNKRNLDNYNGALSLLKTNVCNEDPFMSIKDKEKNKIDVANEKLVKSDSKKTSKYTSKDEQGSLLITHNSVYSPNIPVPGFKYNLSAKDEQTKSFSPINKGNMPKINEAMLSNLCRMCNNVGKSEKNSSRQLNQKTHNFKLYSTAALAMKNKSPSCICVEKRKTVKHVLMSKNEVTGAKHPKGFIKNQRITKILEKGLKKNNPQKSSKYRTAGTLVKEIKASTARQVVERNSAQKNCHLPPQVMSNATKIDENLFNSRFNSSYIERYLQVPPKHIPHQDLSHSKNYLKYRDSSKGRRVANIFKINWSDSQNNYQQTTKSSSASRENDILVRGTCLDHVRNKFVSNKAAKHELNNDAYCDEQKSIVNTMEPSSLSNAFVQYTKDYVKCEYPADKKLPSIRQLHKCAFRSN